MGKIYEQATNPKQYDSEDINWNKETGDSSFRIFYYEYLSKYKAEWKNAEILEIGSGTGWLLDLMKKNGAKNVEGIEPSIKNINFSKNKFSKLKINFTDFENFETNKKYDLIIAVMVFNHLKHIDGVFKKIKQILKKSGNVQIIIPDYEYFKTPRFDYHIEKEKITLNEVAVQITRDDGSIIADVLRKTSVYVKAAKKAGLHLTNSTPLYPTKQLLQKEPKYKDFQETPHSHLLIFKK